MFLKFVWKIFKLGALFFIWRKFRLLVHSRSFLANQKARNAIVRAENLLKSYSKHSRNYNNYCFPVPKYFFFPCPFKNTTVSMHNTCPAKCIAFTHFGLQKKITEQLIGEKTSWIHLEDNTLPRYQWMLKYMFFTDYSWSHIYIQGYDRWHQLSNW